MKDFAKKDRRMENFERIIIDSDGNTEDSLPIAVIDTSYFMSAAFLV